MNKQLFPACLKKGKEKKEIVWKVKHFQKRNSTFQKSNQREWGKDWCKPELVLTGLFTSWKHGMETKSSPKKKRNLKFGTFFSEIVLKNTSSRFFSKIGNPSAFGKYRQKSQ